MSQIAYHQYLTSLEQRGTTHEKIILILLSTPTPQRLYFPHHGIWNERWGVIHTTETATVAHPVAPNRNAGRWLGAVLWPFTKNTYNRWAYVIIIISFQNSSQFIFSRL